MTQEELSMANGLRNQMIEAQENLLRAQNMNCILSKAERRIDLGSKENFELINTVVVAMAKKMLDQATTAFEEFNTGIEEGYTTTAKSEGGVN